MESIQNFYNWLDAVVSQYSNAKTFVYNCNKQCRYGLYQEILSNPYAKILSHMSTTLCIRENVLATLKVVEQSISWLWQAVEY